MMCVCVCVCVCVCARARAGSCAGEGGGEEGLLYTETNSWLHGITPLKRARHIYHFA